jgi:predicted enzyme related to lactoylglutathione lyase
MEKVTGIGGVFFKADNPAKLADWYREHLGIVISFDFGSVFKFRNEIESATTTFSIFSAQTQYFEPSTKPFMINFRVRDLDKMLAQLRAMGDKVDDKIEESEFGRFGWVMDPEGNRIEIWQPPPGM